MKWSERLRSERGSVSAEFIVAMPAVALVLIVCLSGIQVAALQVRLQDAASIAARAVARDDASAAGTVVALVPGAVLATYATGEVWCAQVSAPATGVLSAAGLRLEASSCTLGGGR